MRGLALTVLLGVLVVGAGAVGAADWGGVIPGESTKEIVRARHGDPTRATTQKVDRFDSAQWVYEGDQAPTGMFRMTVDFGLAGPAGFRADVVRSFKLEPHPGIFTRPAPRRRASRRRSSTSPGCSSISTRTAGRCRRWCSRCPRPTEAKPLRSADEATSRDGDP